MKVYTYITCPGCGERLRVTTGSELTLIPNGIHDDEPCIRIDRKNEGKP